MCAKLKNREKMMKIEMLLMKEKRLSLFLLVRKWEEKSEEVRERKMEILWKNRSEEVIEGVKGGEGD